MYLTKLIAHLNIILIGQCDDIFGQTTSIYTLCHNRPVIS